MIKKTTLFLVLGVLCFSIFLFSSSDIKYACISEQLIEKTDGYIADSDYDNPYEDGSSRKSNAPIDHYESNDQFSEATYLGIIDVDIPMTFYGTIFGPSTMVAPYDVDYYRLILPADAEFHVYLSDIPSNNNYNIKLYRLYEQNLNQPWYSSHDYSEIYELVGESISGSNGPKHITVEAQAGEYTIRIASYGTQDENNFYRLDLLALTDVYHTIKSTTIQDLKNAGNKLAVWKSDFYPLRKSKIQLEANNIIAHLNYDNPTKFTMYENLFNADQEQLMDSAIYVWDSEIKAELYDVFSKIYLTLDKIRKEGANYEYIAMNLNISSMLAGAASLVFGFIPGASEVLGSYSLLASFVATYVIPKTIVTEVSESIAYFAYYMGVLEPNSDGSYNNETICIRNYIRLKKETNNGGESYNFLVDLTPRYYGTTSKMTMNSELSWRGPIDSRTGTYNQVFFGQIYGAKSYTDMEEITGSSKQYPGALIPGGHVHDFSNPGNQNMSSSTCDCGFVHNHDYGYGNGYGSGNGVYHDDFHHEYTCVTCGYTFLEEHWTDEYGNSHCQICQNGCVHDFLPAVNLNNGQHERVCRYDWCNAVLNENHMLNNGGICWLCGWDSHVHNHNIYYSATETTHTYKCSCGVTKATNHTFQPYTSTQEKCTVCNYVRNNHSHNYSIFVSSSRTSHTYKCSCGGTQLQPHTYSGTTCVVCGYFNGLGGIGFQSFNQPIIPSKEPIVITTPPMMLEEIKRIVI